MKQRKRRTRDQVKLDNLSKAIKEAMPVLTRLAKLSAALEESKK